MPRKIPAMIGRAAWITSVLLLLFSVNPAANLRGDEIPEQELQLVRQLEKHRIRAIEKVVGSVIAIYDENRQGGGSGVIIDPSGIALTNHHVIMGAGISGWGGLADGNLYPWKLIGTDPGGDVAIIQMEGKAEFPFTPLGNSDDVRVGDWALAMGNPFILTEDQSPTITLGIVSGVKRFQPGAGANQLVYGNCIQVDSSINPGNSGGPLFNLYGRVIGINGRGSFKERGRVNVGLGYAISSNQIKNFIPDLLATKLVEHATLDASFSDRDGKVICSTINRDAPIAVAGLALRDELLEFEGIPIKNANQFLNLICTLPEDWPATLKIRKPDEREQTLHIRMLGLPYPRPNKPKQQPGGKEPSPEQKEKMKRQLEMVELLSAPPGEIRYPEISAKYAGHVITAWQRLDGQKSGQPDRTLKIVDTIERAGKRVGQQELHVSLDGRFKCGWNVDGEKQTYLFDGKKFYTSKNDEVFSELTLVEAKLSLPIVQALSLTAVLHEQPFQPLGEFLLDGSDKALAQNAYRIKLTDHQEDPFYFWLRMYDPETGLPAERLLKASADPDGDEGAVTFHDWQDLDGLTFPARREFVIHLDESNMLTLNHQSHQWLDKTDDTLFELTTNAATGNSDGDQP